MRSALALGAPPVALLLALASCSRPRDPPPAGSALDTLPSISAQLAVGESVYFRGQYDSARAIWSAALEQARTARDSAAEARLVTWLGLAAWRLGDYAQARRLGEFALALKLKWNLQGDLFRSYNALGLLAWNEGRLTDARELFAKAADAARATDDQRSLTSVSSNMALVETQLGRFAEARRGFLAAREGARTLGDARVEGNAANNLGMLAVWTGDPQAAISLIEEARLLYRSIDYTAGEQNALGQLGTAYAALGEPRFALLVLDSALALARRLGQRQEEASQLEALGRLYRESGDLRRALELVGAAEAINRELGLIVETGNDLRSRAEIHAALGDPDIAARFAREALRLHRESGSRYDELADLLLLAELAAPGGRPGEADGHLAVARALAARMNTALARMDVALAEARIADRARDARRVLRVLGGVEERVARGGYGTEWQVEALRSRALAWLGRLAEAREAGRRAVAAVERVRSNYGSAMLRTAFLSDKASVYTNLVDVLVRMGRAEEALAVSDGARGRALLERAPQLVSFGSRTSAPMRFQAEREELLRRIDRLAETAHETEQRIVEHPAPALRAELDTLYAELTRLRRHYEALVIRAQEEGGAGAGLLGAGELDVTALRAALRPEERLVEYFVADDRVRVFVVSRDTVVVRERLISRENLASRVRIARAALAGRDMGPDAGHTVLGGLHDVLFAPARHSGLLHGARRLIVVPHAVLAYLPFAALWDDSTGRYVVEDHAVVLLPSAAALPALRSAPRPDAASRRPVVFAPEPDSLPATRGEARAVADALGGAEVRMGRRAGEQSLRRALGQSRVVHVAAHAALDPGNPLFSRIELVPNPRSRRDDDGRLELHELLGLTVASSLVFLSGCETALGPAWSTTFATGEDYATLAQAFLYAGARNVVATLWRVEDEGAAVLAERFYRHLRSAEAAEALALAQREMIREERFAAPYHWAAYAVSGDGDSAADAQNPLVASVQH